MAKAKKANPVPAKLELATLRIPCRQRKQYTAYLLGVHHGTSKAKPWKLEKFCYQATQTAYALGLAAGTAWRALQLNKEAR